MAGARADSGSIDWCTPLWITDGAHELWKDLGGIHLDPCGNPGSQKRIHARKTFMLPDNDGLKDDWSEDGAKTVYVNPPFGTYYMHNVTKAIVLPKELKEKIDALAVDPKKPTREEKRKQKEFRAQFLLEHSCYSISDWTERCAVYGVQGMEVLQLGPANVETAGWQDYVETATCILYPRGRIYFEQVEFETGEVVATGPAPMPCSVAYWGLYPDKFREVFEQHGKIHGPTR